MLGCRVDAVDTASAIDRIVALARGAVPSQVVTVGTEMVMRAQRDAQFRAVLNGAALALCDTVGLLAAAQLHGLALRTRVTGIDLLDPLCARLAREGLSIYLLGARGATAARAGAELQRRHPGLKIAGSRDGYFTPSEDAAVAAGITATGADVLLAGLGSPRQDLWIAEHLAASGCGVGIGVGGSFDVLAGNAVRAPETWRRAGLEWLYRLVSEPSRWRRQLVLPQFALLAAREILTERFARRTHA